MKTLQTVMLKLDQLLTYLKQERWLKEGNKQRTDFNPVLAAIRTLNPIESVGEMLQAALNTMAGVEPELSRVALSYSLC